MTRAIYFCRGHRPAGFHLNTERNITFVNRKIYLGVNFNRRITCTIHIKMIDAETFRTFISVCTVLNSDQLSSNINLTAQNYIYNKLCVSSLGMCGSQPSFAIAAPAIRGSLHEWWISKADSDPQFACSFQNSVHVYFSTELCRQESDVVRNHESENVRNTAQCEAEQRGCRRLKLGGVQACRLPSDWTVVMTEVELDKAWTDTQCLNWQRSSTLCSWYIIQGAENMYTYQTLNMFICKYVCRLPRSI
jgi:hypothetical protein